MNIHELANKTGIGLATLRKLERAGALKIDGKPMNEGHPRAGEIKHHLMRNQQLTVSHMLVLIDEPDVIDELGKYADRARGQMAEIGDAIGQGAPKSVTAFLPDAAKGDREACLAIADWLFLALPDRAVSYHWIAMRLLAPLNETLRDLYAPLINLALMRVRQLPEMANAWHREGDKNSIVWVRPAAQQAAPLDL